jgi:hypothetical protein
MGVLRHWRRSRGTLCRWQRPMPSFLRSCIRTSALVHAWAPEGVPCAMLTPPPPPVCARRRVQGHPQRKQQLVRHRLAGHVVRLGCAEEGGRLLQVLQVGRSAPGCQTSYCSFQIGSGVSCSFQHCGLQGKGAVEPCGSGQDREVGKQADGHALHASRQASRHIQTSRQKDITWGQDVSAGRNAPPGLNPVGMTAPRLLCTAT